jgi:hypothetical protein
MADLKNKDISKLESWNEKELRKLKISINNRISALKNSASPKVLPKNHPLFELDEAACGQLLHSLKAAEKKLSR